MDNTEASITINSGKGHSFTEKREGEREFLQSPFIMFLVRLTVEESVALAQT